MESTSTIKTVLTTLFILFNLISQVSAYSLTLRTWDGDAGDGDFNNGINWSGDPASLTSSDSCVLNLNNQSVTLSDDVTIGALNVKSTNGWDGFLYINGNQLIIEGNLHADTDANSFSQLFVDLDGSTSMITVQRHAFFDQSGAGTVYVVADQTNPGTIKYYKNVTCGNSATTATDGFGSYPPGNEPNVVYDGAGTQTVSLANQGTAYFLSATLTIGDVNNPTVNLTGTGVAKSFGTYDGSIVINSTLDINTFTIDCNTGADNCPQLTINNSGVLKIGGTGDFPNGYVTDDVKPGSFVHFDGTNQTICNNMSSTSVGNLYLEGSGTKTWNVTTAISNNLLIDGTVTADLGNMAMDIEGNISVTANATLQSGSATHTLAGNFDLNGSFQHESGKWTFDGTTTQVVAGDNNITFNEAEVNNNAGLAIANRINVAGMLTFNTGDIQALDENEPVYITNTGSVSGASDNSHLVGYIVKQTNSTAEFVFPIGDGTAYRYCSVTPEGNGDTEFTARYFNEGYSNQSTEIGLNNVSLQEYWNIDRGGGAPVNAKIKLSWNQNSFVGEPESLVVAHFDGSQWESTGAGTEMGNNNSGNIITDNFWSSFSPFTLGSTSGNNPLPVELVDYFSVCENGNPVIKWSTASEVNSDYFQVEASKDGVEFRPLDHILSKGNSSIFSEYQYNSNVNANYFRLLQYDYDGTETNLGMISNSCGLSNFQDVNESHYSISDANFITVYSIYGQELANIDNSDKHILTIDNLSRFLSNGTYILKFFNNNYQLDQSIKVLIK